MPNPSLIRRDSNIMQNPLFAVGGAPTAASSTRGVGAPNPLELLALMEKLKGKTGGPPQGLGRLFKPSTQGTFGDVEGGQ